MVDTAREQRFKGPIPPHAQLRDFLPPNDHKMMIDWALSQQSRLRPAEVNRGDFKVDREMRVAEVSFDLGLVETMLRERLMEALPTIREQAGIGGPMPNSTELQFAAHGQGAHYRPHVDVLRRADGQLLGREDGEVRLLSGVYYFHRSPRASPAAR